MKDLISNYYNQSSNYEMMQKSDKKIEKEISDMVKKYSNDKVFRDSFVTDYISMSKSRIGQNNFRDDLIKMHSSKCILSNVNIEEILIASHIIPWATSESKDRLNPHNGLLLSSSIDKLFDRHLISFNGKGELFYSDKLIKKYPNYMKQLEKIGIHRDYLYNKKSIFSEIDINFHENIKFFLSEHLKKTKENN